ncbi:hypothetical protein SCLCIDRAFT_1221328 [Scleroderma citrinum Foug A]|uniref:Uncharacterized protein n=1 Tax=Scleroderma citrinum Foug A TaxID=1036808 RepID=A0A0C3DFN5_9AGAM|nr:hypothetical protein SCLCIDRAFT_1221328 [Scleroderma citrinum Foug A]
MAYTPLSGLSPSEFGPFPRQEKNSNTNDLSSPNVTGAARSMRGEHQFLPTERHLVAVVYALPQIKLRDAAVSVFLV